MVLYEQEEKAITEIWKGGESHVEIDAGVGKSTAKLKGEHYV